MPDAREIHVQAIAERVRRGEYRVDAEAVARAILIRLLAGVQHRGQPPSSHGARD